MLSEIKLAVMVKGISAKIRTQGVTLEEVLSPYVKLKEEEKQQIRDEFTRLKLPTMPDEAYAQAKTEEQNTEV